LNRDRLANVHLLTRALAGRKTQLSWNTVKDSNG
jgi:hypothetical protein